MSRAEKAALKAYPQQDDRFYEVIRECYVEGYEQAEESIIEHCEKRIAEYNAQNLSNMFLRRAFEDVIRFIKETPYNDYKDDEI